MEPIIFRGKKFHVSKGFFEGTHRICSPEATWEKIRGYASQIGVSRLAHVSGLDRIAVPVTLAIRPRSRTLVTSSGKGLSWATARVSGMMEALEIYCAEECEIPFSTLSYNQLKKQVDVIPHELLSLRKGSLFHPDLPEKWAIGWDIFQQREVAVPVNNVGLNFLPSHFNLLSPFKIDSNGLASGNHFLEALSSAIYEVIERDGISCHHVASTSSAFKSPCIRNETIPYPAVQQLIAHLSDKDFGISLSDCSVDTEVPIFMATLWDRRFAHTGIARGYGAHLDIEVAMIRALTEAIQGRLAVVAGSRDDIFYSMFLGIKKSDSAKAKQELENRGPLIDLAFDQSKTTATLEGDIHILLKKLKKVGINQLIVFDLSRPEFDVSVVRVIIPGMEGYCSHSYIPGERAKSFAARVRKEGDLSQVKGVHFPAGVML